MTTPDLLTIDPATAMPSDELDALIATEWMGWSPQCASSGCIVGWLDSNGAYRSATAGNTSRWMPTTNAAHAGEARRRAEGWLLSAWLYHSTPTIRCEIWLAGRVYKGYWLQSEAIAGTKDGIAAAAEALATSRAILAAVQARAKEAKA